MISVIIPYVKDRGYLSEAIASVEAQTFTDWEIIEAKGDRLQGANINWGICQAKGEYIKILHDDDKLPPNSLQDLYDGIQGFDWVCAKHQTFGDPIYCPESVVQPGGVPVLKIMVEMGNMVNGGTTLYSKKMLDEAGGYNEKLWTGEEYELHLRLLDLGYKVNFINKVTHLYRLHQYNKSYFMGPGEKKERKEFIKGIAGWYK